MNRTDRLLAIVLNLQARGRRRAEDLAATFETSLRTIYRDIAALCEAGVPIVALPGQGYTLAQDYFLPPLQFSVEEAGMLVLGSELVALHFDREGRQAAKTAAEKIAAVLPEQMRAHVGELQKRLRFSGDRINGDAADEKLRCVRQAVLEQRRLRFLYHARRSPDPLPAGQKRECAPYALANLNGTWYLSGHCYLRDGLRFFRLERMDDVELLEATFERPPDYALEDTYKEDQARVQIVALFAAEVARWVKETRFHEATHEEREGGLLVRFNVHAEEDVLAWFLRWGRHVRVLEPESLRNRIAGEARALLDAHGAPAYS